MRSSFACLWCVCVYLSVRCVCNNLKYFLYVHTKIKNVRVCKLHTFFIYTIMGISTHFSV